MTENAPRAHRPCVVSVEEDADFITESRVTVAELGLDGLASVHHAPLVKKEVASRSVNTYDLPAAALAALEAEPPDLVFIDGPGMAGGRFARWAVLHLAMPLLPEGFRFYLDDALSDSALECARLWAEVPGVRIAGVSLVGHSVLVGEFRPRATRSGSSYRSFTRSGRNLSFRLARASPPPPYGQWDAAAEPRSPLMKRTHALLLALLVGVAVVAATFAVVTTTSLGTSAQAAPSASSAKIATRSAALDKAEAALRHGLKKKPPALPKLPKRQAAQTVQVVSSSAPAQPTAAAPSAGPSGSPSSDDPPSHETEPQDNGGGDD